MKKTLKIIMLVTLSLSVAFAVEAYYANQYLFNLNADEMPLTKEQMQTLKTPYPHLNKLIKKYDVVRIEPWLKHAKADESFDGVYLNRVYRLVTSAIQPAPLLIADEIASSSKKIMNAEPEAIMRTSSAIPNDPGMGKQWFLHKANVPDAWKLWNLEAGEVPGDRSIVVAVVDDGVEYTHPDLWKNIWINQDEISATYFGLIDTDANGFVTPEEAVAFTGDLNGNGKADLRDVLSSMSPLTDGVDNDSDGYIDNIIGWDTNESGRSSDDDKDPMVTNNSHGTHVAGLVGATSNNGVGVASAAYNISIMAVKATGDETVLSINTGYDGMLYAAQAGADIINCSWGGPGYNSYAQTLIYTITNTYGSLMIAAAGNGDDYGNPDDTPHYPSGYDNVISVTAVSSSDVFSWANYGAADGNFKGIDISAPGESLYSTYLTKDNPYAYLTGTSMASPFVASCFALLKSVYPDSSNEWLTERMLNNTDPIDHLNPDFAGELGRGRVNMLKALVFDKWPNLSVAKLNQSIGSGDGDSILNPGETVDVNLELMNDSGWTQASQVSGVLSTDEEGVLLLDSIASWSSISSGSSLLNEGNGFKIQFDSDAEIKTYSFNLDLLSNEAGSFPYRKTLKINIDLSLVQEGFPFYAKTEVEAGVVCADVNDNGNQEIIFADKSGYLYIIDAMGDTLPNFPIALGSQPGGIAVADIDLDDTLEIVTTLFDKKVQVYDVSGKKEWSRKAGLFITGLPAIGNLDADPELEVVFTAYDQKIYAVNHDSTDVPGFPYLTGQLLHSGPSLADINGDGKDNIIVASKGGQCLVLNSDTTPMTSWPVNGLGSIIAEPQVILGNDTSAVILVGNEGGDIYALNIDGSQRFSVNGSGSIRTSPALYFDGGEAFAFFATTTGNIYKIDLNTGDLVESWPKTIASQLYHSLTICDIPVEGSMTPCILAMGNNGKLYTMDLNGNSVGNNFPLDTKYLSKSSPVLSDIDADGDLDIITGNYSGVTVQDLKTIMGTNYWPMHKGSADRRGSVSQMLTSVDDGSILANTFELMGNYPNPFNPTTMIRFTIPSISTMTLKVYSLDGKEVYSKAYQNMSAGVNEIDLNMNSFASGLYIYSLRFGDLVKNSKMILMK